MRFAAPVFDEPSREEHFFPSILDTRLKVSIESSYFRLGA